MGAWGPGIFSDDTACDVRDGYSDLIGRGVAGPEATRQLMEEYRPADDPDEGAVFWLALAATQWKLGRLEDAVRDQALQVIDDGANLRRWEQEATREAARKRRAVLERLRAQLLSPQPPVKRVSERYIQETEFEEGDVIAYRLRSGRFALLRVVGHHVDRGGRTPIVEVLNWTGEDVSSVKSCAGLHGRKPSGETATFWHYTPQFLLARLSKTDYPASRLQLVRSESRAERLFRRFRSWASGPGAHSIFFWKHLDQVLREGFGLE